MIGWCGSAYSVGFVEDRRRRRTAKNWTEPDTSLMNPTKKQKIFLPPPPLHPPLCVSFSSTHQQLSLSLSLSLSLTHTHTHTLFSIQCLSPDIRNCSNFIKSRNIYSTLPLWYFLQLFKLYIFWELYYFYLTWTLSSQHVCPGSSRRSFFRRHPTFNFATAVQWLELWWSGVFAV